MLLDLPAEILVKIVYLLPLPDRCRLGTTCEFLYHFEKDTGHNYFDGVTIVTDVSASKLLIEISGKMYEFPENERNWMAARKQKITSIFKNASIGCLDLQGLRNLPVALDDLQSIQSATYQRLKIGNRFRNINSESLQTSVLMFVNNDNFKRESLDLHWNTMDDQTERDEIAVFRSLPPMKRLDLIWLNKPGFSVSFLRPRPEIDSTTLLGIVEKIDNVNFTCANNTINAQTLLNVFRIVCGSTVDRRVRIMSNCDHFRELIEILLSDMRFEKKDEGWWRDRESGAVMFCGESFMGSQTLTFMKSSIGYKDVDNGECEHYLPCYYNTDI